jgi:hypothetical protein
MSMNAEEYDVTTCKWTKSAQIFPPFPASWTEGGLHSVLPRDLRQHGACFCIQYSITMATRAPDHSLLHVVQMADDDDGD